MHQTAEGRENIKQIYHTAEETIIIKSVGT
jgi:hypothetical protein